MEECVIKSDVGIMEKVGEDETDAGILRYSSALDRISSVCTRTT